MNLHDMFEGKGPTALEKWRNEAEKRLKQQAKDQEEFARKQGQDFEKEFANWQQQVHGDHRRHMGESTVGLKREIQQLMAPAYEEGSGGWFGHTVSVKAPTMAALREKYYDDLDAIFSKASPEELQQALRELRAMYGKTEGVAESKGLSKRVEIIRGLDAGKRGYVRQIKTDKLRGIKYLDLDLEDGGQTVVKSTDARLVKDLDESWSDKYVAQRTGRPRTPYSVYISGKKWKDFENDDHARAVMDKLKAKFKADGRNPETVTIAPTDLAENTDKKSNKYELLQNLARQWQDGSDTAMDQLNQLGWNIADDRRGVYVIKQSDMSGRSKIYFPELTAEDSMAGAAQRPTGPEFTGYWKGTDSSTPGKHMVGCEESRDTREIDTKTGKVTKWSHEGDWKKSKNKDPRGEVTHMSDVARRKTEKGDVDPVAENRLAVAPIANLADKLIPICQRLGVNPDSIAPVKIFRALSPEVQADLKHKFGPNLMIALSQALDLASQRMAMNEDKAVTTRNFVAKNAKSAGAGQHRDKKRAEKQGDVKHKKQAIPMDMDEGLGNKFSAVMSKVAKKVTAEDSKQRLDPKCWDGYKKQGTKMKGGVRVNNCVPKESVEEEWSQKYKDSINCSNPKGFSQKAHCAGKKKNEDVTTEDWQKANKKDKTDGMSKKAVKAYRREHPGSKLQTAVTTKPSKLKKGSKASKRRKSYCSRSKGQMKMHNISCQKTPDKAICKARRRWNCEESTLAEFGPELQALGGIGGLLKDYGVPVIAFAAVVAALGFDRAVAALQKRGDKFSQLAHKAAQTVNQDKIHKVATQLHTLGSKVMIESVQAGEYLVWTVYFDDGTSSQVRVPSDETPPQAIKDFFAKKGKTVIKIDYNWNIHGSHKPDPAPSTAAADREQANQAAIARNDQRGI